MRYTSRSSVSVVAILSLVFIAQACGADWPHWRGPDYDGISREPAISTDWSGGAPELVWEKDLGIGASAVSTSNGRLYTMGNKDDRDYVYCLDAATGKEIWTFDYPCEFTRRAFEGGTASTPTIHDGKVYTISYDGQVHCIDDETGKKLWSKHLVEDFGGDPPRWSYAGSPFIYEDKLIIEPGGKHSLVALNADTGATIWKSKGFDAGYSTPIAFDPPGEDTPEQILIFNEHGLCAFNPDDGAFLWDIAWKTGYGVNAAVPLIVEDKILISSAYGKGAGLVDYNGGSPKLVYEDIDGFAMHFMSPVQWEGYVYGMTGNTGRRNSPLVAMSFHTGEIAWNEAGFGVGTVLIVGDVMLVLSEFGELVAVKPDSSGYKELARTRIFNDRCWVVPVYSNGLLYCRNNKGHLKALRFPVTG